MEDIVAVSTARAAATTMVSWSASKHELSHAHRNNKLKIRQARGADVCRRFLLPRLVTSEIRRRDDA